MNNVILTMIGNGIPELPLLDKEVKNIYNTNNIAALKGVAKKTKNRIERIMEQSDKEKLYMFIRAIENQHNKYMYFFSFIEGLPNKIQKNQKTKILILYHSTNIIDITQVLPWYVGIEESMNSDIIQEFSKIKTAQTNITKTRKLSELFSDDDDYELTKEFIRRNYEDESGNIETPPPHDDTFEKIIKEKYVWQDGVGLVPKSMFKSPIKIAGNSYKQN